MKRQVRLNGKKILVEWDRLGETWSFRIDGQPVQADVIEAAPGLYSILLDGRSFEVCVQPHGSRLEIEVGNNRVAAEVIDPRRLPRRESELQREGRQQVCAPMPGKVVRVLVGPDQPVEAGHGILVLEAMKMQNEVKSPKSGTVERLLVKEGQAVNAGDVLAVVV